MQPLCIGGINKKAEIIKDCFAGHFQHFRQSNSNVIRYWKFSLFISKHRCRNSFQLICKLASGKTALKAIIAHIFSGATQTC